MPISRRNVGTTSCSISAVTQSTSHFPPFTVCSPRFSSTHSMLPGQKFYDSTQGHCDDQKVALDNKDSFNQPPWNKGKIETLPPIYGRKKQFVLTITQLIKMNYWPSFPVLWKPQQWGESPGGTSIAKRVWGVHAPGTIPEGVSRNTFWGVGVPKIYVPHVPSDSASLEVGEDLWKGERANGGNVSSQPTDSPLFLVPGIS